MGQYLLNHVALFQGDILGHTYILLDIMGLDIMGLDILGLILNEVH